MSVEEQKRSGRKTTVGVHTCPLSGKPMTPAFSATVLRKYEIQYHYCPESGLLQTEAPYWLQEAYSEAISELDTGLVSRNIYNSRWLEGLLALLSLDRGKFVDVAGGYGLLTRLLRDRGLDCYTTDPYCQNLFAKPFEPEEGFRADALFAFEVFEHLEDPLQFLRQTFARFRCKTILFSTATFSGAIPPKEWWYYAFESGQHITFYQPRTLSMLAHLIGCRYYPITSEHHLITDRNVSGTQWRVASTGILRKMYTQMIRCKRRGLSKTWSDYLNAKRLHDSDDE